MSGIEIIDNVLLQCYNIKVNQMFFMGREDGIEYYTDIIGSVTGDGYYLINEASNTLKDLDNQNISK